MGIASHLGPWLLGTQKNTIASLTQTNASAGLIRNMGATIVAQSKAFTGADTTANTAAFVIPAGSMITAIQLYTTVVAAAGTITINVGSSNTPITSAFTLPTALGVTTVTTATSSGAASILSNVGSTDQLVTFTLGSSPTAGYTGTFVIAYMVRNSDGTTTPSP